MPHPTLDPRTPVIAGAGVASQHADEPGGGLEAVELMLAAARTAGDDTGAPAILRDVQRVAIPRGTWDYPDPGRAASSPSTSAPRARRRRWWERASRSRRC
jgi:hypothetical protein